ncbi:MmpS family transport accessory protein [Microbacterium sp. p3-SID338]|uniref:MmpS family transport accessory protein n=1 Tax=Microbacterium sp. p3-SID338 TaxID=2916214 RepID=UPI0021A59725|nr:MmpS family transport accessory protein [Microbacterium sp. p3-SID338]MCT1394671.1 MmpS family transport accessory protein [Microbacterium sp. p3-SID338]
MGNELTEPRPDDQASTGGGGAVETDAQTAPKPTRQRTSKRRVYVGVGIGVAALALTLVTIVVLDQVTRVSVPAVEQQTVTDATTTLRDLGLEVEIRTDESFCEEDERGGKFCIVTSQTPSAEERVHADELVMLDVIPSEVSVPTLEGLTFADAVRAGADVAIDVRSIDITDSVVDGHEGWKVLEQSERGSVNAGSTVEVTLERPLADAPPVVGATLQGASDALTAAGFEVVIVKDPGAKHDPSWVVTATDPAIVDGKLPVASIVRLSWGVQLPNVVGMTDLAATSALTNAKVTATGSKSSSQLVAVQDPAAGTIVEPGSTVTITLEPPSTVYEVVSNGSRATITWVPPNSYNISQAGDAPLPWRMSWPTASGYRNFNAQSMDGTSITCNIYVNGQLLKTATSTGRYAVVSCG